METGHLEKRFGVIVIEKGFCSPEQFIEALKVQVMEDFTNTPQGGISALKVTLTL